MTPAANENREVGPRGIAILYAGLGFAWIVELAQTADDEHHEYFRQAEEGCDRLLDICHDAREFSALIDSDPDPVSVDLTAKLREAVAVADEYPEATLQLDAPEAVDAVAVDAIDVAFRHAIENACEHAGERPNVDVTVRERDDAVDVRSATTGVASRRASGPHWPTASNGRSGTPPGSGPDRPVARRSL